MKECEVCANTEMKSLFVKDGFPYQKCPKFGLIRISPQPTDEQLDAIYNGNYYSHWGKDETFFSDMKKKNFSKILDLLPNPKTQNPKLLDIGAATGILMEVAQKRNYAAYGIEAAKDGSKIVEEKFGQDRIFNGYFDENFNRWTDNFFDVIVACDFFEHVKNPNKVLQKIYSLLKPDGYLLIHIPDAGSFARFILGKRWTNFIPEHLFSYTRRNIKTILENNGFSINKIRTEKKYLNAQYVQNGLRYFARFEGGGGSFWNINKNLAKVISLCPKRLSKIDIPINYGQMTILVQKI
jgi:2-polyprenyl-3-methyl-5-hydroxy-6-metoxy-1,4-benzoquinol methylase